MRKTALLIALLYLINPVFAQAPPDTVKYVNPYEIVPFGVIPKLAGHVQNPGMIEAGGYYVYRVRYYHAFLNFGPSFTLGIAPHGAPSGKAIFALPKAGFEANFYFTGARLSTIYYTDFSSSQAVLLPEVGFSIAGVFNLMYGHNLFIGHNPLQLGTHVLTLGMNIPVIVKESRRRDKYMAF